MEEVSEMAQDPRAPGVEGGSYVIGIEAKWCRTFGEGLWGESQCTSGTSWRQSASWELLV